MKHSSLLSTLILLSIAVLAWVGIFFFVQKIHADQISIGNAIDASRAANLSADSLQQMNAILSATEVGREQITNLVHVDLLALTDRVVAAGRDAGVELHVSNAAALTPPVQQKGAAPQLSAVRLTVEGSGDFAKLFHTLMLIESLPIPSRVDAVSFYHNPDDPQHPWSIKVDVTIVTALPVNL
jgi:hypothetical protein